MIFLDDAAWGSLIGGVIIGIYREETKEFRFKEIPVKSFQGGNFTNKIYLQDAAAVAFELLYALNVSKTEPIKICTGYCLDGIAEALSANGYNFTRGKIEGELQIKIETALQTVLETKYGFKVSYEELTSIEKKGLFWWRQIQWLKDGNVESGGFNQRKAAHCKTGWSTWPAWSELPYSRAKIEAKRIKAQNKPSNWR